MTSGAKVWAEEGCPIESTESAMVLIDRRELARMRDAFERVRKFAQRQCDADTDEAILWAEVVSMTKAYAQNVDLEEPAGALPAIEPNGEVKPRA